MEHDIVIKYRKWYQFWKPSTIVMGCSCGFSTTDFKGMASHYRYVVSPYIRMTTLKDTPED